MTLHSFLDGDRFIAHSTSLLAESGIRLDVGYDFEDYRALLKEARPDHILGDPFDPKLHDMDPSNSFYIIGRNASGEIMHTQAMRMIDIGKNPLSEYLRHGFRGFPPSGVDIDMARSRYRPGPGAQRIMGEVCYHGEFWVGSTPRQFRGAGMSCILGRYAFWQALKHWNPDYVFAFMAHAVVVKGFAARHGYMHSEPGTLRWFLSGNDRPVEGFMSYMSREDLRFVLDMPLSDLVSQAA